MLSLEKLYEPITEQDIWTLRIEEELRELYKIPDPVADIKRKILSACGTWSE
jgi:hypothetical protein